MQLLKLAENVSAVTVAAATALNTNTTPFSTGRDIVVRLLPGGTAMTGTPSITIEGSDDNVTFVVLATHTALYEKMYQVKSRRYMRTNVGTGASAGTYSCYAFNGA